MVCLKGTVSFSELIMPTISKSSVNSSLAMPSKHFFRCGCTRSGSLVSDRISSSSSFDRKKNLFQSEEPALNSSQTHFPWLCSPQGVPQTAVRVFPETLPHQVQLRRGDGRS